MQIIKSNPLFIGIITMFILLNSCEFSVTTANVENVKMCKTLDGELCDNSLSVFTPEDNYIYISCNLNNAPDNTVVTFLWKYMDQEEPIIIDEVSLSSSDMGTNLNLSSNLSRPYNGWPTGKYEVEIIIEESQRKPLIQKFEVR